MQLKSYIYFGVQLKIIWRGGIRKRCYAPEDEIPERTNAPHRARDDSFLLLSARCAGMPTSPTAPLHDRE